MGDLTTNFSLREFTTSQTAVRRDIDNIPTYFQRQNIQMVADWLQALRDFLNDKYDYPVGIHVSSGFRSRKLNMAIGGSSSSAHVEGLAADITATGLSSEQLFQDIKEFGEDDQVFPDQVIQEFDSWVHVGLSESVARNQYLRAIKIKDEISGKYLTRYILG